MWLDLPFAHVSRSVEQNVNTTFCFSNPLSGSEELQSWGCSKIMLSFFMRFDRYFLNKSATTAMFTSVRVDFGRPPLSSSSTGSLLSREYHLNAFDRFKAPFPLAFCTNTSVSVADRPALKQYFMATLFISAIHDV